MPTNVLWLFLTVPWVGLQCAIVVFADHTHLLFGLKLHLYFFAVYHGSLATYILWDKGYPVTTMIRLGGQPGRPKSTLDVHARDVLNKYWYTQQQYRFCCFSAWSGFPLVQIPIFWVMRWLAFSWIFKAPITASVVSLDVCWNVLKAYRETV